MIRTSLRCAIIFALCCCLFSSYLSLDRQIAYSDFAQDYVAGVMASSNQPIYGSQIGLYALSNLGLSGVANYHPPFLALIFGMLSSFDYLTLLRAWTVVFALLFLGSCYATARRLQFSRETILLGLIALTFWPPFLVAYHEAPLSLCLALLTLLLFNALTLHRNFLAGLLLALLGQIKLFPLLLVLHLIFEKNYRALIWTTVFLFSGSLLILATLGQAEIAAYATQIIPEAVRQYGARLTNVSAVSVLLYLGGTSFIFAAPFLTLAIILSLLLIFRKRIALVSADERFSSIIVIAILASPLSWQHYSLMLIVPLLIAIKRHRHDLSGLIFTGAATTLLSLPVDQLSTLLLTASGSLTPTSFLITRVHQFGLLALLWTLLRPVGTATRKQLETTSDRPSLAAS